MADTLREPASFRYTLPPARVASAAVDIGHITITVDLLLSGDLDVAAGPVSSTVDTVDTSAIRAAALKVLRDMATGLMVRGFGSAAPSIASAAGHVFTQRRHEFRTPNTITFAGDCEIDFNQRRGWIDITVTGTVGYSLEVTALPVAGELSVEPPGANNGRGWFVRHDKELASIGMVVLVAVPIVPARLIARDQS